MAKLSEKVSKTAGRTLHKSKRSSVGGKSVSGASLSDTRTAPWPNQKGRGIGSSYVMAVNKTLDDAENMKGSKTGFLGKEKESIQYKRDQAMLYKGKGKKLKQGEDENG